MDDNIVESLRQQGMSEKEVKVYLTLLELGSAPASSIARRSGINRSSMYVLLKKMRKEGYVQEIIRKDVSYFSVVSPELLLKSMEHRVAGFKEILPQLLTMFAGSTHKPVIKYFEGEQGLKKMFELFSTTEVDMRAILGTPKYFSEKLTKHVSIYRNARRERGLQSRRIVAHYETDKDVLREGDKTYNRQTRIIDELPFDVNADINIFGPGKVTFLFFDSDNIGHLLLIENQDVYQSMYSLFEFMRRHSDVI